jgi:hypothetical protein
MLYHNGISKDQFISQAKKILEAEQMKECTFKPDLITMKSDLSKSVMSAANESKIGNTAKYEQLYSLAKQQKAKIDKSKEDYEFEKAREECTFAPKL